MLAGVNEATRRHRLTDCSPLLPFHTTNLLERGFHALFHAFEKAVLAHERRVWIGLFEELHGKARVSARNSSSLEVRRSP